ncbi:hypothetical protein SAMN05216298_0560 [Glycomyces sambucus]|uniref:Uncharacterized protein n=1 Tax=Glycomyces sambucus TaxID=380244 RepID=A0A1G9CY31_9ACTN|nr:hypothetical protein [Glycomyces sambucus]SDK56324.1 hypothetical protein SAMN05216298_0560 [Glycomyces sambucus]
MNEPAIFRDAIRAVAFGDGATARRIHDDLDEAAHERLFAFAIAVMSVCIEHRFAEDATHEAFRAFANEMREDFRDADPPPKPLAVEVVLRGFAGEDHLLDEIPVEDQTVLRYPLIRKIVADDPELQAGFDGVLDQAEALLEAWAEQEP